MEILLSLIALLIAFSGGLGMVLLLSPVNSRGPLGEICGTALILGAGIVSLLSFGLGFLIQGSLLRWTITSVCAALLALGCKRHRRALVEEWRWPQLDAAALTTAIVVVLQLALVTWLSLYRYHLGWDGLFNWESKARITFYNDGAMPLQFYTSGISFFHNGYPLFFRCWRPGSIAGWDT
jgi:hypothetical protein